jgi:hypothetical protein
MHGADQSCQLWSKLELEVAWGGAGTRCCGKDHASGLGRDVPRGLELAEEFLAPCVLAFHATPADAVAAENLGEAADLTAVAHKKLGRLIDVIELPFRVPSAILTEPTLPKRWRLL